MCDVSVSELACMCPWISMRAYLLQSQCRPRCPVAGSGTNSAGFYNTETGVSARIEPMVELIHCSHQTVHTNQTICWDLIETERSEATIPRRRSLGDAKRQTPRVTAWSLWPVVQKDLVPLRPFISERLRNLFLVICLYTNSSLCIFLSKTILLYCCFASEDQSAKSQRI